MEDNVTHAAAARVYHGILQLSTTNHIYRRVNIPELGIDVKDVRFLKEKGRTFLQQKMRILFACNLNMNCWSDPLEHHAFQYSEGDVLEAYSRAWASMEQREVEDKEDELAECYDDFFNYSPNRRTRQKQKRAVCKRKRWRGVCRWERQ